MRKKLTSYLIYRHGSNAANQSMCNAMPVCIVDAASRQGAIDAVRANHPEITVYANQYLTAIPKSRVSEQTWNEQLEYDAQRAHCLAEAWTY